MKNDQDAEFHESLFADAEKARERERLDEDKRDQEALEAVLTASRSSAEEEKKARTEARRLSAACRLEDEPPKGTENCVFICFRLPAGGKRIERRFYETDTLTKMLDFLKSLKELSDISWELHQAQPAKCLNSIECPNSITLKALDLCPRALLLVRDADA